MGEWVCRQSGDCCRAADGVVMTVGEWAAVRAVDGRDVVVRELPDGRVEVGKLAGRGCPYYDGGCRVYAVRPGACRAYGCFRTGTEPYTDTVMLERLRASAGVRRTAGRMLEEAERWTTSHEY